MVVVGGCESVVVRMVAFIASHSEWPSVFGIWRSVHHGCNLLALACRWCAAKSLGSRWCHCMHRGDSDHHVGSENIAMPHDSHRVH